MSDRGRPGHDAPFDGPADEHIEPLHRAIDRVVAGQPAPLLDDPGLQELLLLASRLRDELPPDMPDPAFRAALKTRLTQAGPTAVASRRVAPAARLPRYVAAAAIAAMFVVILAAGSLGVWLGREREPAGDIAGGASSQTPPVAAATIALATSTLPDIAARSSVATAARATLPPSPFVALATSTSAPTIEGAQSGATPSKPLETAPAVGTRQLATLPPVEPETVEMGPVPAAEGGSSGPDNGVLFVLDAPMPDLGLTAPVYRLKPPDADPHDLMTKIADALGMAADVDISRASGHEEWIVTTADNRAFYWSPESGAFSYTSPDAPVAGDLTPEQAIAAARAWLDGIGYPVEKLGPGSTAERFDEGQWLVDMPIGAIPQPGVGHPLGVRLFVNGEGVVLSASGYWCVPDAGEQIDLMTAEEIWSALLTGAGYWMDGGMSQGGGELRVTSMAIGYVLTRDDRGLILQPVVRADGNFRSADGLSTARVSVFVKASRSADDRDEP